MKTMNRSFFYFFVFLLLCGLCASPLFAGMDEKEMNRLEKGEVIVNDTSVTGPDGLKQLRGNAVAIIDAPPQEVWNTIMDHEHFEEFMPALDECSIVEDEGNTRVVSYRLKIAWADISYFLKLNYDRDRWHADGALDKTRPHKIADSRCTWDLEPLSDGTRTLVNYSVYVDSGRFVPKFIERLLSKRQLPNVLKNVRERTLSGGTWKK